jgi:hypothetical protein
MGLLKINDIIYPVRYKEDVGYFVDLEVTGSASKHSVTKPTENELIEELRSRGLSVHQYQHPENSSS